MTRTYRGRAEFQAHRRRRGGADEARRIFPGGVRRRAARQAVYAEGPPRQVSRLPGPGPSHRRPTQRGLPGKRLGHVNRQCRPHARILRRRAFSNGCRLDPPARALYHKSSWAARPGPLAGAWWTPAWTSGRVGLQSCVSSVPPACQGFESLIAILATHSSMAHHQYPWHLLPFRRGA